MPPGQTSCMYPANLGYFYGRGDRWPGSTHATHKALTGSAGVQVLGSCQGWSWDSQTFECQLFTGVPGAASAVRSGAASPGPIPGLTILGDPNFVSGVAGVTSGGGVAPGAPVAFGPAKKGGGARVWIVEAEKVRGGADVEGEAGGRDCASAKRGGWIVEARKGGEGLWKRKKGAGVDGGSGKGTRLLVSN